MLHKSTILLKGIESMYDATCTITGVVKAVNEHGIDTATITTLYENVRCHVAGLSAKNAYDLELLRKSEPMKKIFLSSDLNIPVGSSFTVTRDNGYVTKYKDSSKAQKYEYHQEIVVVEV